MSQPRVPPRSPGRGDFPRSLTVDIVLPPSTSTADARSPSVLLLLHGLGDTQAPFAALGRALNLPTTVILALRGPSPLPPLLAGTDGPAFHWGDDVLISSSSDALDLDAGFETAARVVWQDVVADGLVARCGYRPRDVLLWGFGQGAMAALAVAAARPDVELAGVVAVGARLPAAVPRCIAQPADGVAKARTPILLLGGSASRQLTRSAVADARARFATVEYVKWAKPDDSMPKNRDEMLPIMRFLASRLPSNETGMGAGSGSAE